MLVVEEQIETNKSATWVFDCGTDRNWIPAWRKGLVDVRRTSIGDAGVYTLDIHISALTGCRGEAGHELLADDRHQQVATCTISGPFPGCGFVTFISLPSSADSSGATLVTRHSEGAPGGVCSPLAAIPHRQRRSDLPNFRQRFEVGTT